MTKTLKLELPMIEISAVDLVQETNDLVIKILEYKVEQNDDKSDSAKEQLDKLVDSEGHLVRPMYELPESNVVLTILVDPIKRAYDAMQKIQETPRENWLLWRDDPEAFPTGNQWVQQYFWALETIVPSCNIKDDNESWAQVFSGNFDVRAQYLDDLFGILVLYYGQKRFFGVLKSGKVRTN